VSIFDLFSVLYFPACTDVNGTVYPNCADMLLRTCSLTHYNVVDGSFTWHHTA